MGRLVDYKGLEDLVKAIYIVRQSGRQIRLDIVGKGQEDYEAYLSQLIQSMKLGNYIHLHGWRPTSEVRQRMTHAKSLVVPSRREAYGLVALEGMSMGVPLIASRAGGLAEIVSTCALTFEAGNINQLAGALMKALDNPSYLYSLAVRARERALSLDWRQLAPRYLTLLEKMRPGV